MALPTGTRLGPYEIVAPIGAGGMGEVYRARDTRLDRTVAVKVLPPHLTANPEIRAAFRARFEREARAVSSLNHPNICILHDIGEQDGVDYLVMEYLEGETLAARLANGPLPAEEALRYAIQIADALGQAHRQGVFHRDLKPGNVMLTKTGSKLLDFGLAKLQAPVGATVLGDSALPTEGALTQLGTILGTFQYMAPEQLEGKKTDGRADIFSFGAVLFEMATGRRAFAGTSHASLIASILSAQPPPVSSVQPLSPPALDRIVQRCLAKDPEDRWQTALDLAAELKWIAGSSLTSVAPSLAPSQPAPSPPRPLAQSRLPWALAATATLAALLFAGLYFRRPPAEVRAVKLTMLPPEKATFGAITVSPDGRRLAFVASEAGKSQLWIRSLDSLSAQPLPGTEGASYPFWSPDSRFIGFFAQGKLKKIEASGGPPQTLCDAVNGRGGSWNRDGVIVFSPGQASGLLRVQAAGGEARPVTTLDSSRHEASHRWPHFLPDGRHYLVYVSSSTNEHRGIHLAALASKDRRRLVGDPSNGAYARPGSGPGHLLFVRDGSLMAQPFDAGKLVLGGEPFPVAERIGYDPAFAWGAFSVSDTGVLVYDPSGSSSSDQLAWFDRQGKRLGTVGAPGVHVQPWLSPDEKVLAVERIDVQGATTFDIWLHELSRDISSRFTFDSQNDLLPVWSPDGSRIAFASNRDGAYNLYLKSSSGAGKEELLQKSANWQLPTDFSRDGRFLAYMEQDSKTNFDLWVLPGPGGAPGDRKPMLVLQTPFNESWAQFSPGPEGRPRWIAYHSDESKREEVYVMSFGGQPGAGPGGKWQISNNGGSFPKWRRDGKELFYLAADKKMMAVEVQSGPDGQFQAGSPRPLFETRISSPLVRYTVTGDGQRFLVPTPTGEARSTPATVVLNWTAAGKR